MVGFSGIRVGLWVIILLQVKVLASSRQNIHIGRAKLADSSRNSEITAMESEQEVFKNHGVRFAEKQENRRKQGGFR